MTLLQLQYFKTLAHVLHYTQTAAQLHIAQPSLSYSIKELEKELGVKLFEKDSRHVRLTIYGEQFLPYAERALSMLDEGWACCSRWRSTPSRWSAWAISTPSPPPSFPR